MDRSDTSGFVSGGSCILEFVVLLVLKFWLVSEYCGSMW